MFCYEAQVFYSLRALRLCAKHLCAVTVFLRHPFGWRRPIVDYKFSRSVSYACHEDTKALIHRRKNNCTYSFCRNLSFSSIPSFFIYVMLCNYFCYGALICFATKHRFFLPSRALRLCARHLCAVAVFIRLAETDRRLSGSEKPSLQRLLPRAETLRYFIVLFFRDVVHHSPQNVFY
jgi:hypothetical protein